jgi:hypothetical protein
METAAAVGTSEPTQLTKKEKQRLKAEQKKARRERKQKRQQALLGVRIVFFPLSSGVEGVVYIYI